MDPQRSNFSELESFITSNPLQADSLARQWDEFVKRFKENYPEVARFESGDEFFTWAQRNPQLHIDTTIWRGKEITQAYDYTRNLHEQQEMEMHGAIDNSSVPVELLTLPFLAAAFRQKKILEDDGGYRKIVENKQKEWLKNNRQKDFLSVEGLRFLYGDPNDRKKKGIYELAREEFAKDPKNEKKLQKYTSEKEKVYKNPKDDRAFEYTQFRIAEMKNAYYSVLKKQHSQMPQKQLEELVKKTTDPLTEKEYDHFVLRYGKRAVIYAAKDEQLQYAVERTASKHKDVPSVEKTHRKPDISVAEANKRIADVLKKVETSEPRIILTSPPQPPPTTPSRELHPPRSFPSSGRVVNTANKLVNRVLRTGQVQNAASRAAITVGKNIASRAVLLLGAWGGPVLLIIIMLFTFVLVGFTGGEGGGGGTPQTPGGGASATNPVGSTAPDGKHACPVVGKYVVFPGAYANIQQGEYSFVCGHHRPIYNANDIGVSPNGGTAVLAAVAGMVDNVTNPYGGPALWLMGDDGLNYYYAHLRAVGLVTGRVVPGQVIGHIAAASENAAAKNNGIAHVHFSAGTPGNKHTFDDPPNVPAGPLLDSWCNINVCNGQPNRAF